MKSVTIAPAKKKQAKRTQAQIDEDLRAYRARGGKIQKVPFGVSGEKEWRLTKRQD